MDIWRLPLVHCKSLSNDPQTVTTKSNALLAAFCAASLFFAVFRIVSYISECLRRFIVSEVIVTPVGPAPPTWPCAVLMFARRFTPLVVIWTCCGDVEGVAGGGVPSPGDTSALPGTPLGLPPNWRFQRSKHSQGVRLSIEIVTRAELKESVTRVQLEGYLSTKDLRRASSEGFHAWSSRFLLSFGGCGTTIPPMVCGLTPSKSSSNEKRNKWDEIRVAHTPSLKFVLTRKVLVDNLIR